MSDLLRQIFVKQTDWNAWYDKRQAKKFKSTDYIQAAERRAAVHPNAVHTHTTARNMRV